MLEYNSRRYGRGRHFICTAKISKDGADWVTVTVKDMSSGGVNFVIGQEFELGQILRLDMRVEGFLTEFELKVKGEVRHKRKSSAGFVYGVEFVDLPHDMKIRIDQNVSGDRPVSGAPYSFD